MKKEEQSFDCGISVSQKGHALSGWILRIVPIFAMLFATLAAKAASDGDGVKFNPGVRYSQWAINSRLHDFYGNTKLFGFDVYDANNTKKSTVQWKNDKKGNIDKSFDYVAGLVAKATLEAADYYAGFDWSKPWFYSAQAFAAEVTYSNDSKPTLDAMNAVKMYFPILSSSLKSDNVVTKANTALANLANDMKNYNTNYSIGGSKSTLNEGNASDAQKQMFGGWFHKSSDYVDQMWLDGAYMGSATLAQLTGYLGDSKNIFGSKEADWNMVAKQLNIVWNQCWDSNKQLMYHAFSATGDAKASTETNDTWAGISNSADAPVYHSAAFWGRANSWYFFALVDALEAMKNDNQENTDNYKTLKNHLDFFAAGIVKWQDKTTGGWYQVMDEKGDYKASNYNSSYRWTTSYNNYIETSATAIFSAALFKAVRLGLLGDTYRGAAKKAFEGIVNNFVAPKADGTINIWSSSRSAGLGGKNYRDGSKDYYILGTDTKIVTKEDNLTEGKVLGGFIMAATEYERAYQNQDGSAQILFSYDLKPAYDLTQSGATAPVVEVCGTDAANATYQWYDATTNTAVEGATEASFTPSATGDYYCKATVGNTSIQTSATNIKVNSNSSADKQKFTVTATAENGTVEIKDGAGNVVTSGTQVEEGTKLVFTANANTGYVFDSWTATGGEASGNVYTISSIAADANVKANFIKENTGGGDTMETTLFSMVINSSPASLTVAKGTAEEPTLEQLTDKHAAITGGTVTLVNTRGQDWTPFSNASITVSDKSKNYIRINLDKSLDDGDVINIKDNSKAFKLSAEASSSNSVSTSNGSYTLDANSVLKGKNEIFVFWSDKSNFLSSITITRKTTTPTTSPLVIAVENVEMNVTDEETLQPEVRVYGIGGKLLTLGSDYTLSFSTDNNNVTINDKGVFTAAGSKSNYTEGVTTVTVTATPSAALAEKYTEAKWTFKFTVRKGKDDPAKYRVKAPGSGVTYSPMTPLFNQNKTLAVTLGGWIFTDRDTAPVSKEGLTYGKNNKWADDSSKATWVIKGFDYYLPGLTCQNARQEDGACPLPSETQWYDGKLQKVKGGTVDPMFYVPCSGAYLTVEPKTNGKVSVSVFQNGVFDKSGGVYAYRPQRRVFVLDEAGKVVASEATISATGGKLTVADKNATDKLANPYDITNYPCNITGLATGPATTGGGKDSNPSPKVEEVMKHFRGMTSFVMTEAGFQNNVYESNIDNKVTWGDNATPNNGADDNVKGSHGWSVLVDAAVTYTFDVKAGKTYYIYNYGSKLGFYGFSFDEAKGQKVKNYEFNDDATNTIELTKAGELATAKVNRAMKAGVWTTCVLPFSLNKQQVDAIFGKTYDRDTPNGTQILYFDRVEGTKAIFVRHAYNNIVAGKPFLIKPTKDVASINTAEVEGYPYVTIENTQPAEWCKGNGYVWMSSYSNDLTVKEGDCFISNKDGSFKNFVGALGTLKGFRGYLKNIGTNGVSEAKKLTVGIGSNVTTDETSAIDGILIDGDMPADSVTAADGKVYNLNGQVVATSYRQFQALPGGVYVVNGKKVVK